MSEAPQASRRRRPLEFAVLGIAILIAAGVTAYLFIGAGSDDEGQTSPEDVTRAMYFAVTNGDQAAFDALLDPDLRDSGQGAAIPFGTSVGGFNFATQKATVDALAVSEINRAAGWASVGASGTVTIDGKASIFQESLYLRQSGNTWLISTEGAFLQALGDETPSGTPNASGLGPLDAARPKIGSPAPDFALIDVRDPGVVHHLSDYRGKAVVVNWFASWCGPCQNEIPEFEAAYTQNPDTLVILGVDYQESAADAQGILDELHATYPAVLDSDLSVAQHYRVGIGLPSTFFVDKDGILQDTWTGDVTTAKGGLGAFLAKIGVSYTPVEGG